MFLGAKNLCSVFLLTVSNRTKIFAEKKSYRVQSEKEEKIKIQLTRKTFAREKKENKMSWIIKKTQKTSLYSVLTRWGISFTHFSYSRWCFPEVICALDTVQQTFCLSSCSKKEKRVHKTWQKSLLKSTRRHLRCDFIYMRNLQKDR